MPQDAHYTVRRTDSAKEAASQVDPREQLGRELADHYDKTYAIVLEQRRRGRVWRQLAVVDVYHPDEPIDNDLPRDVRVDELVDIVFQEAEGDGGDDAPREVRAYGVGERKHVKVWGSMPTWIVGEGLAMTPREASDSAVSSSLLTMSRMVETMGRTLDRALARVDQTQQRSLDTVSSVMGKLDVVVGTVSRGLELLVDAREKAGTTAVALRSLQVEERRDQHAHDEQLQRQESDDTLLMFALETAARAYMSGDDEPEAGEPGDNKAAGDTPASDERKPAAGRAKCRPARELAGIFREVGQEGATKIKGLLSEAEWSAIDEATRCTTVEQFDACFARWTDALERRPDQGAQLLHDMAPIVRANGLTLMRLQAEHAKRTGKG